MTENEKHYLADMHSICKVIVVAMSSILILCAGLMLMRLLGAYGLLPTLLILNECKTCDMVTYGLILYSAMSIIYAKYKMRIFNNLLN